MSIYHGGTKPYPEWEKEQQKLKIRTRPIGSKATLNGKPVLWAGPDYEWQSPGSFKKLENEGYFAPGEAFARKALQVGQKVGEAVGPWIKSAYDAANSTWLSQGALQQQIGTATLMSADKAVQASAQLIQDNTPLGPAGSNLATNFTIDLALANAGKLKYGIQFAKNANNARRVLALRNIGTALTKPDGVKYLAGLGGFGSDIADLKTLKEIIFDFSGVSPGKLAGEKLRSQKLWQLLEERNNPNSRIDTSAIDRQLAVLALTDMKGDFAETLAKHKGSSDRLIRDLKNNQARLFEQVRRGPSDPIHHTDQLVLPGKHVVTQKPAVRTDALQKRSDVHGNVYGDQTGAVSSMSYDVHKIAHESPAGKVDWPGNWISEATGPALPAGSSLDDVYQAISKTSELSTEATRRALVSPEMTRHAEAVRATMPTNLGKELGINFDPYATDLSSGQIKRWRSHLTNLPKEVKLRFDPKQPYIDQLNSTKPFR